MSQQDFPTTHANIHTAAHLLHQHLEQALEAAGLGHFSVDTVRLYLKQGPATCPDGSTPQWAPEVTPDGHVVYRWICKR